MSFSSLYKYGVLTALISSPSPAFCKIHGTIHGDSVIEVNATTVLDYFVCSTPVQEVKWSLPDPNSGQISQNGVYKAPDRPGIYRVRAVGHRYPAQIAETEIHVKRPYPRDEVWEIDHGMIDNEVYQPRLTHLRPGHDRGDGLQCTTNRQGVKQWNMETPPHFDRSSEWAVEVVTPQGKTFLATSYFGCYIPACPYENTPQTPHPRSGYFKAYIGDDPELGAAKIIRFLNAKRQVLHEEKDVCSDIPAWQTWIVRKDDVIWFQYSEKANLVKPTKWPFRGWDVDISWDNGTSWMPVMKGNDHNNWSKLLIPQGGLRDVPNPLLRFSISRGFRNSTKIDTLQNFLDKTPKHLEKEIIYKPKPRVDPVVPPDDPNDNF